MFGGIPDNPVCSATTVLYSLYSHVWALYGSFTAGMFSNVEGLDLEIPIPSTLAYDLKKGVVPVPPVDTHLE